jgi:crotonobetainyl-CoA:carnitine CoA-transferase CaiB-like acyl-CoA transferase
LTGVRVIDVTSSIAGPWATMLLGALGAEVVKVEPPSGDDTRGWGPPFSRDTSTVFLAVNPSKLGVTANLREPDAVARVRKLAAGADVFVQSLRPGLAEELGLGYEEIRAHRPDVVYCSIEAFGAAGPRASDAGYDPLMQAAAGIMSITGEPEGTPVRAGPSIVDQGTGLWAALGIVAAVHQRESDGCSKHVQVSLYETAVNWMAYQIAGFVGAGHLPGPLGSGITMIAPYECFDTRGGAVMIAAGNDRIFQRLVRVFGCEHLATDARFATNASRVEHRDVLHRELQKHVPAAPVRDVAQVVADPQLEALDLLQQLEHPEGGELTLVAPALRIDGARLTHLRRPPRLGEHDGTGGVDLEPSPHGWQSASADR